MTLKCVNIIDGLEIKNMIPLKHLPSLLMFNLRKQESQPSSLVFWQRLKVGEGWESFTVEKRKSFSMLGLEVVDIGRLGRQTRSRASHVIGQG